MLTLLFADLEEIIFLLLTSTAFVILGALGCSFYYKLRKRGFRHLAAQIVEDAECRAATLAKEAELQAQTRILAKQQEWEISCQAERAKMQKEAERLQERDERLEKRMSVVDKKISDLERRELALQEARTALDLLQRDLLAKTSEMALKLENIARLDPEQARRLVLDQMTQQVNADVAAYRQRVHQEAEEEAAQRARSIIASAINRLAVSCVSEAAATTVTLPNEDIKGRIIGREGRNIRCFERLTGVNVIIDDTPGAIVLSGFDPMRKYVAKTALIQLIKDGRIHPTSIEEAVENARVDIDRKIKEFGHDAAVRAGVLDLHPEMIVLLGRLKFRFSYGQNVLDHSLEVSHLMGLMAAELDLDVNLAKRIGLLHDVGKALSQEVEGSHAMVGYNVVLKYGEGDDVANGIGCHHGEMTPATIEGSLCAAADALSASRPGARIEAVEEYIKRLKKLEEIAYGYEGVQRAYALQAGREVHVAVCPDALDDNALVNLARSITKRIEEELSYPGKIKVIVMRERRAIHYAV